MLFRQRVGAMPGYLEGFGAGEEKREGLIRRIALYIVLALCVGGVSYSFLRNYREARQARLFFESLRNQDYATAYRFWGCTLASPCRGYPLDKFMEDWGPKSPHADLSALKITMTRGCSTGVIIGLRFGAGEPVYLWVNRQDLSLGFAPQYDLEIPPVCNPRMPSAGPM